jgi:hypothetical protein
MESKAMVNINHGDSFDDEDTTPCGYNSCDWAGPANQLACQLWDIPHLCERIAPEETVPAGECPECGALASVVDRIAVSETRLTAAIEALETAFTQLKEVSLRN